MLRSCSTCGRIHDSGIKCRRYPPRMSDADRFRNTKEWQDARNAARERDVNLCVVCRSLGEITTDGLSVHHIVPLEEEFALRVDMDNLITLCGMHHEEAERGDISRSELRRLVKGHMCQDALSPPV